MESPSATATGGSGAPSIAGDVAQGATAAAPPATPRPVHGQAAFVGAVAATHKSAVQLGMAPANRAGSQAPQMGPQELINEFACRRPMATGSREELRLLLEAIEELCHAITARQGSQGALVWYETDIVNAIVNRLDDHTANMWRFRHSASENSLARAVQFLTGQHEHSRPPGAAAASGSQQSLASAEAPNRERAPSVQARLGPIQQLP